MNGRPPSVPGTRPQRGRPTGRGQGRRRRGAPTQARLLAVRVLERVDLARAYADLALHAALARSDLAPVDRSLATELVYGTLRWRGRLDHLLGRVLDRDLEKLEPLVASILRVGAYQIVFSERIPASAAIDQSVSCARALGAERAGGLVNAVLRRLAHELPTLALPPLAEDPLGHLIHALSFPAWLAERFFRRYGAEEAAALERALNEVPPRTVRANPRCGSRERLLEDLRSRFPNAVACHYAPDGVVLGRRGDPGRDPAFLDGRCTVQDEASQLVVTLLDPQPGEKVLDVCAAPGAKSTAIAERVGDTGRVLALDRNARRLGLLRRDARRLGLGNVRAAVRDATEPLDELAAEGPFDRVLVDAPCSGIGAVRRNPDARWRVRPTDVPRLAETQALLIRRAADAVRPGGHLVYSTCTLLEEENEAVVAGFLAERPDFRPVARETLPAAVAPLVGEDGFMRCLPHRHDTDGFFAARVERRP